MGSVDALGEVIGRFGLPSETDAEPDRVMELIQSDKKKVAGSLRWVLPRREGGVIVRSDIPELAVRGALESVTIDR